VPAAATERIGPEAWVGCPHLAHHRAARQGARSARLAQAVEQQNRPRRLPHRLTCREQLLRLLKRSAEDLPAITLGRATGRPVAKRAEALPHRRP